MCKREFLAVKNVKRLVYLLETVLHSFSLFNKTRDNNQSLTKIYMKTQIFRILMIYLFLRWQQNTVVTPISDKKRIPIITSFAKAAKYSQDICISRIDIVFFLKYVMFFSKGKTTYTSLLLWCKMTIHCIHPTEFEDICRWHWSGLYFRDLWLIQIKIKAQWSTKSNFLDIKNFFLKDVHVRILIDWLIVSALRRIGFISAI